MPAPCPQLVSHISKVLGQEPTAWQQLQGGQTNSIWKIGTTAGDRVIKIFARGGGNPLFPNSAQDEAAMLRHLSPQGLAPQLHFVTSFDDRSIVIYDHVSGESWHRDVAVAARALAMLHAQPAPTNLRHLPGGSERLTAQTAYLLALLPADIAEELQTLRPSNYVGEADFGVLLHGDPVPGNLIVGSNIAGSSHIKFIDWQCPAIGDPVEDLALFLSPAMQFVYRGTVLSTKERAAFLAAYGSEPIAQRVQALAPWYHWRMAAYCAWKLTQGQAIYRQGLVLEREALAQLIA